MDASSEALEISPSVETQKKAQIIPYTDAYQQQTKELVLGTLADDFDVHVDLPDLDNISDTYQKDNGNFWVAVDKGKVVGAIALRDYGEGRGMLKRFYVEKPHRGTDVASNLFSTLLTFAQEKQYKDIYLTTTQETEAAQKFFRRHGFAQIPELPEDIPDFGDPLFYKLAIGSTNEEK